MFGFGKKAKSIDNPLTTMIDTSGSVSPERMEQWLHDIKAPLRDYEQEKRKSLETNAGFFEKLSAISAGSIAVSASIILAVLFKAEPRPEWIRAALHELLLIVGFLWLSLVLAILHNFLAAVVARTTAKLSEAQFTWILAEQAISIVRETTPEVEAAVLRQAKDKLREQFAPREVTLVNRSRWLYATANVIGYISMLMFLVAFSLVPIYLFRLW
jgi:hypothetical protein